MIKKTFLIVLALVLHLTSCTNEPKNLDLSGDWSVCLDSTDVGLSKQWNNKLFDTPITLPGTTDMAHIGVKNQLKPALTKPQLLHLTRAYSYIGPAWYSREITVPSTWKGKELYLHFERVLWDSQVWIDGVKVEGHEESLTTPHRYDLTPYVKPGTKHLLSVRVDNRKRYDMSVKELAHAYTEDTQVKWNGILGDMYIEAVDKVFIHDVQVYPSVANHMLKVIATIVNHSDTNQELNFSVNVEGKEKAEKWGNVTMTSTVVPGEQQVEMVCNLDEKTPLWDEFNPYLCQTVVSMDGMNCHSEKVATFGLRKLERDGNRLKMNDRPIFLRGTLECCIFPLTGTPPTDEEGWRKVFGSAREYGMNHLRFHSWCPPEAAFNVADEMGFYVQVELPVWSVTLGQDKATVDFLRKEARRISTAYGNHPSFCFWSLGNELQNDFDVMASMLKEIKEADSRHLYTTTSFTFENGHGIWPEPNDDYFVTQWTKNGWMRGQGVFNSESPSFDKDFRKAVEGMEVPAITHEVGQYSVYPDITEIDKYTGTLIPLNFMAVKEDLQKKNLLDKAPLYLKASGALAALLYKEELERAMKTPGISGIQLLDLHDFPGQGTALVGLLNAFWESKGIISGDEFREFCCPVVPLLRFPKAVYTNTETFEADIELCNYGKAELADANFTWTVKDGDQLVADGHVGAASLEIGLNQNVGKITLPLNKLQEAKQLEVSFHIDGTEYKNRWNIWVYPSQITQEWGEVKYTQNYTEALALLAKGEKVLFNPDWHTMKGIEGKFVPVFWSPVHFPKQAGTMGILCDPKHPALREFPTDIHSDWQWWDLNVNSTTLVVDELQGGASIVDMIDNFVRNRRTTSLYEGKVGEGKLVIATFDLNNAIDKRPVARQMLKSILTYMNSTDFEPAVLKGFESMGQVFGTVNNKKQAAEGIY